MRIYTNYLGVELAKVSKFNSYNRWIYDRRLLLNQVDNWSKNIPWIKPYYAMKSNSSIFILRDLIRHPFKVGFDASSNKELKLSLNLTYKDNIIYTNPHTILHEYPNYLPILKVIDSISELDTLIKYNVKNPLLIRIESGITSANCNFDLKFGANIDEGIYIINKALQHSFEVKGISFHIGSGGIFSRKDAYIKTYNKIIPLLEILKNEKPILNFGGGLLHDTNLTDALGWTKDLPYTMIAEPGRYFSTPSFFLATQVISKTRRGIFLDNGVYHELNVIHRDHWKFPKLTHLVNDTIITKLDKNDYTSVNVFGPTCDNYDTVGVCNLPSSIKEGDWILLPEMGSYTSAGMVEFNGINGASSISKNFFN